MATPAQIAAGLKTALAAITSVRAHEEPPQDVNVSQGKVVAFPVEDEIDYHEAFDDGQQTTWNVVLLAAPVQAIGYAAARRAVRPYLARSGDDSIKAKIEADETLGGVVDTLCVTRAHSIGRIDYGDVPYWGAKVEVQIWD